MKKLRPLLFPLIRTVSVSTSFGVGASSVFWGIWTSATWILLEAHWYVAKDLFKKDSLINETESN